jgi:hypothetical protein
MMSATPAPAPGHDQMAVHERLIEEKEAALQRLLLENKAKIASVGALGVGGAWQKRTRSE